MLRIKIGTITLRPELTYPKKLKIEYKKRRKKVVSERDLSDFTNLLVTKLDFSSAYLQIPVESKSSLLLRIRVIIDCVIVLLLLLSLIYSLQTNL